jgi:hypothetical protein
VLDKIKKSALDELRFSKVKIAHTLDMNVNINYTAVDIFRGMQANIQAYDRGIICGSSSVKRVHQEVYEPSIDVLGCTFPAKHNGAVWTTDPKIALQNYFKDFYLSTNIEAGKDKPWVVTATGDGLRCGPFEGCFAAGVKKVSAYSYQLYVPA